MKTITTRVSAQYKRISEIPDYPKRWELITKAYAERGFPSISYVRTESDSGIGFESVLFRDRQGKLLGVLDYFSTDGFSNERRGNINVVVHTEYHKMGIGSQLLKKAIKRWDVNLEQQEWTPAGFKLIQSYLKNHSQKPNKSLF